MGLMATLKQVNKNLAHHMMHRCICISHNCKQIVELKKGGTGVGWGKSGHYLVTDVFRSLFDLFQIYINPLVVELKPILLH